MKKHNQTKLPRARLVPGLTQAIIALASQYGRYGYRRIKSLLDEAGWDVGCNRVPRMIDGLFPEGVARRSEPETAVLSRADRFGWRLHISVRCNAALQREPIGASTVVTGSGARPIDALGTED